MSYFLQEGNALNSIAKYQSSYVISNLSHAWNILVFFFIIMNESQALLAFKIFFFPESICPYWRKVHKAISRIKAILYCVNCHFLTRTSCLSDDIPVNLSTIIHLYSLSIDILILFFFVTLSLDVTNKHLQNL